VHQQQHQSLWAENKKYYVDGYGSYGWKIYYGVGYYGDFGVNGGGFGDIDIGIDSDY
jgi:hypothetical protein